MSGILHLATDKLTFKVEAIQEIYTFYPNLNTLMISSFDVQIEMSYSLDDYFKLVHQCNMLALKIYLKYYKLLIKVLTSSIASILINGTCERRNV